MKSFSVSEEQATLLAPVLEDRKKDQPTQYQQPTRHLLILRPQFTLSVQFLGKGKFKPRLVNAEAVGSPVIPVNSGKTAFSVWSLLKVNEVNFLVDPCFCGLLETKEKMKLNLLSFTLLPVPFKCIQNAMGQWRLFATH
jgi:hypothetical protein